jgi:hypothetical protein
MNDIERTPERPRIPLTHFDDIGDGVKRSVSLRGLRRALAVNAVQMAREHGNRGTEPWSQNEADVVMAVMELLDKVAAG